MKKIPPFAWLAIALAAYAWWSLRKKAATAPLPAREPGVGWFYDAAGNLVNGETAGMNLRFARPMTVVDDSSRTKPALSKPTNKARRG